MAKDTQPDAFGVNDPIGTRIVQAAAEAIVEHGFGGATTETIARAARTSKRSLYQRFPDKQSLFENVMAYLCASAPEAAPDPRPSGDLEADLRRHALAVLDRFTQPQTRAVFAAAIGASGQYPQALEVFWTNGPGQAVDAIAKALSHGKRQGKVGPIKPGATARQFLMNCVGPVVLDQLVSKKTGWTKSALLSHVDVQISQLLSRIKPAP